MPHFVQLAADPCMHGIESEWCVFCSGQHMDVRLTCHDCRRTFNRSLLVPEHTQTGGVRFRCVFCCSPYRRRSQVLQAEAA